jgi:hypothetical protein
MALYRLAKQVGSSATVLATCSAGWEAGWKAGLGRASISRLRTASCQGYLGALQSCYRANKYINGGPRDECG